MKHGRIAMAATVGMLVQENYRFQGLLSPSENLSFSDVPNGLAALDVVPLLGWVQLAVLIGAHEVLVKQRPGKKPGDFGTGYLGVAMDDESSKQLRALNVEIQNGRLAMLGILGMFASENIHVSRSVLRCDAKIFLLTTIQFSGHRSLGNENFLLNSSVTLRKVTSSLKVLSTCCTKAEITSARENRLFPSKP